jgi:hypothetical protein
MFGFLSCERQELRDIPIESQMMLEAQMASDLSFAKTKDLGIENLDEGEFHNYLINLWLNKLSKCPKDINLNKEELKNILILNAETISRDWNFNQDEFLRLVNLCNFDQITSSRYDENFWLHSIKNSELSQTLKDIITDFNENLVFPIDKLSVFESNIKIVNFYLINSTKLNNNEVFLFEHFIDVALSSNVLWKSTEAGGLNMKFIGDQVTNRLCKDYVSKEWKPYQSIMADATGILSGAAANLVATGGACAIPNPLLGGMPSSSVVGLIVGVSASINTFW